ncbi:Sec-independent protein translocase protein TatB [uncultured Rhodoblastus sp.]|uniref:Sec-independent protein translocase protein TatB n=1 Tax=uncultured Rhodoblastus sp. TaxID=543037 RepID=UPI0025F87ED0|nr:Sec-independent protein translocase protein TatB [uncultured Rhodoblastus sp.]
MFDFDIGKLLLIGVVALIFIPPKDLPETLRQLGRLVGKARRLAGEFQSQFNEAIRDAELDDLKNEFRHLKDQASAEMALKEFSQMVETATVPEPAATAVESPRAPPEAESAVPPATEAAPEPAPVPPVAAGSHS